MCKIKKEKIYYFFVKTLTIYILIIRYITTPSQNGRDITTSGHIL